MRLAIFTHVIHKKAGNSYYGYGPYIREINLWLQFIQDVEVVAPVGVESPTAAEAPYRNSNLLLSKIPNLYFGSAKGIIMSLQNLPIVCIRIIGAMRKADHLHIRCPGNIGLISSIIQIFFPKKPKTAKYAGNWDPTAKQPWTYKFQKWLLSNTFLTRNMQVLVYGEWPGQSKNIKPFFTASFHGKEISEIKDKEFEGGINFLFVGNLVEGKQPLEAIKLIEELNEIKNGMVQESLFSLLIYGDGPERQKLEIYVRNNKLEGMVIFMGIHPLEEVKEDYQNSHFVILPSRSEGWPKAIAEGMFYGCIPIATPVSCVPWMLGYGNRGVLLHGINQKIEKSRHKTEENGQNVRKIQELLADQEKLKKMSEAAKDWSQQYTLEKFEAAIQDVLAQG